MKDWIRFYWFPVLLACLGLVLMGFHLVNTVNAQRPGPPTLPPTIDTYRFPPGTLEGQPPECAGDPDCGVLCFYISENATANKWELSCLPWVFSNGSRVEWINTTRLIHNEIGRLLND